MPSTEVIQLTLILKMTTAQYRQVVETLFSRCQQPVQEYAQILKNKVAAVKTQFPW